MNIMAPSLCVGAFSTSPAVFYGHQSIQSGFHAERGRISGTAYRRDGKLQKSTGYVEEPIKKAGH
jgi:hypothetical protein